MTSTKVAGPLAPGAILTRHWRPLSLILMVCAAIVVTVFTLPALSKTPLSFGRIPADAWLEDGSVDSSRVPDYIVALDRNGDPAGYVRAEAILPDSGRGEPVDGPIPVVDERLNLVGHMVPRRGFVPLGTPFDDIPPVPTSVVEDPATDG